MTEHRPDPALRELLDAAAPEEPELDHAHRMRSLSARSRGRTRRFRVALGGALTAVVGVGVAVPVLAGGGGPAADPAPHEEETSAAACPNRPVDVRAGGLDVEDLPAGATSVRWCPAVGPGGGMTAVNAEVLRPVVAGAARLVEAISALPASGPPRSCAGLRPRPLPWALVIGYPDGSTRELGAVFRTCTTVRVGDRQVAVERVIAGFEAAQRAER